MDVPNAQWRCVQSTATSTSKAAPTLRQRAGDEFSAAAAAATAGPWRSRARSRLGRGFPPKRCRNRGRSCAASEGPFVTSRNAILPALALLAALAAAPAQAQVGGVLPPYEIITMLRSTGLDPVGRPVLQGRHYVLHAVDRDGEDVRVTATSSRSGRWPAGRRTRGGTIGVRRPARASSRCRRTIATGPR
jgi:hypothetical protein